MPDQKPFFAISFLACLQTIPRELYDAADIDGATGWRKFWHVTLPLIKPVAIVVIVFSVVITFADFQLIYVLTRGGDANCERGRGPGRWVKAVSGNGGAYVEIKTFSGDIILSKGQ